MKENTHKVGDDFNIRNGVGQSNFITDISVKEIQ